MDLGVVCAIASSFLDRAVRDGTVVMGEIGLTGEVRAVSHVELRVAEAHKMGFTRCLIPAGSLTRIKIKGIELVGIKSMAEAMEHLF